MHFEAATPKLWKVPYTAEITPGIKSHLEADFYVSCRYPPPLITRLWFKAGRIQIAHRCLDLYNLAMYTCVHEDVPEQQVWMETHSREGTA